MEVRITGRHTEVDDRLRQYAQDKLAPLSRYYDRTRYLEVVFDENTVGRRVEVIAHMQRGQPLVATIEHKDPMAAVDLAHDKLERLLTREKERRREHKHKGPGAKGPRP